MQRRDACTAAYNSKAITSRSVEEIALPSAELSSIASSSIGARIMVFVAWSEVMGNEVTHNDRMMIGVQYRRNIDYRR